MGDVLTWGASDDQAGEEAGAEEGRGGGEEPPRGPDAADEGGAEVEAAEAEGAVGGEGGAGEGGGWGIRAVVDARTGEEAEDSRLVLLGEETYAELAGSAEAFTTAQVHAQKIQNDDVREAVLCGIELTRAVCAAIRSKGVSG